MILNLNSEQGMMTEKLNKILLIDDDDTTNYVNKVLIVRAGCCKQTVSVTSGQSGLDYLSTKNSGGVYPQPDLIFLDINMPVMDGWEFIEKYSQLPAEQRGNVLVWVLSTSNNPEDRERALKLGSNGFMAKPLTITKLMDVIKRHFPERFEE